MKLIVKINDNSTRYAYCVYTTFEYEDHTCSEDTRIFCSDDKKEFLTFMDGDIHELLNKDAVPDGKTQKSSPFECACDLDKRKVCTRWACPIYLDCKAQAHDGINAPDKTVVLAVCQYCNRAIAGGWYGSNENKHREEDIQDWVRRGFRIIYANSFSEVTVEQHSDDCPLRK